MDRSATESGTVSVITATRGRPTLLRRALRSVSEQCCHHVLEHKVIVDDCPDTWAVVHDIASRATHAVTPIYTPRPPGERTGPRRHAVLRDIGIGQAHAPWIAFLDDDNMWRPDHLHSLLAAAFRHQARAAHSWCQLINRDGTPYLDERVPWDPSHERGRQRYLQLLKEGVVRRRSNVYRDRADPEVGGLRTVDGGEWLLDRKLAADIGFTHPGWQYDMAGAIGDDDLFLEAIMKHEVRIVSTYKPTLIYQLGGFSNNFSLGDVSW